MQISEYENIYKNEATHFYYAGNHNLILALVKKYIKTPPKNTNILDAGCGTGLLAKKLKRFGGVWAIDISNEAIKFARRRKINATLASVTKLPFKANMFDLVTSIDVIYHKAIEDDQKALREFFRVLRPNGIFIIRVPANRWLMRSCDKYVHARRRYEFNQLKKRLIQSGFAVDKLSFINMILLPPVILSWLWERICPPKTTHSPLTKPPSLLNKPLSLALAAEFYILERTSLPFGLGLLAVCHKPEAKP